MKYGYLDREGRVIIEPRFEDCSPFSKGLAAVKYHGKWGVIDTAGKWMVLPEYDGFGIGEIQDDGLAVVYNEDHMFGIIDKNGEKLLELTYDGLMMYSGPIFFKKGQRWGMMDRSLRTVIEPEYDHLTYGGPGLVGFFKDGRAGYMDESGRLMIEPAFDHANHFQDGLANVSKSGKKCVIDLTGKVIIDGYYDNIGFFSEGMACVEKDWKWGYVDKTGKLAVGLKYTNCREFVNGCGKVSLGGVSVTKISEELGRDNMDKFLDTLERLTAIVNENDKIKNGLPGAVPAPAGGANNISKFFSTSFREAEKYQEPKIDKWSIISDNPMKLEGPPRRDEINGKWGLIDKDGKTVVPIEFDYADYFYEDLAAVKDGDNVGFYGRSGKVVIPLGYEDADSFHEGLARVKLEGKWGLIDSKGKFVIKPVYDMVGNFEDGLAFICRDDKWGSIDSKGDVRIGMAYEYLGPVGEGLMVFGT